MLLIVSILSSRCRTSVICWVSRLGPRVRQKGREQIFESNDHGSKREWRGFYMWWNFE